MGKLSLYNNYLKKIKVCFIRNGIPNQTMKYKINIYIIYYY